jgi:hypothetical protein
LYGALRFLKCAFNARGLSGFGHTLAVCRERVAAATAVPLGELVWLF